MTNRADIDKEIEKLKASIAKLEKTRKAIESLTVQERIADYLHENLCHWNHVDGCGWEYESWEKPGATRKSWVKKAQLVYSAVEGYVADVMYESGIDNDEIREKLEKQEKMIEDVVYQIVRAIK